jgi:protein transport protein SEC23
VVFVQVNGLLGSACRAEKKSTHVSDTEIGQGGTTLWKMCGLDQDTTLAVFFEVTGTAAQQDPNSVSKRTCTRGLAEE